MNKRHPAGPRHDKPVLTPFLTALELDPIQVHGMSSKTQLSGHILHPGMDSSWFADGAHRASMRALSVPEPLPNIQTIDLHRQGRPEAPPGTYFPAWSAPSCDLNPVHIWSRFNGLWGDTPVGSDLIITINPPLVALIRRRLTIALELGL